LYSMRTQTVRQTLRECTHTEDAALNKQTNVGEE
jgi:hypothetical protein